MQISEKLLRELQNRLKTGNRRGVHLNAIPGRSRYKIDLSRFASISETLPTEFINTLLGEKSFKFPVSWQGNVTDLQNFTEEEQTQLVKLSQSIDVLINQITAIESEKGTNTFGFGYPILLRKDKKDGKLIAAPILIWSLQMKRSKKSNTWTIERKEDDPVYFNEVLKNHLWADSQVSLRNIPEEILEDNLVEKKELAEICTNLLKDINSNTDANTPDEILNNLNSIEKIRDKKHYEGVLDFSSNSIISYGGLLSIFEVQKQSIIEDYEDLLKATDLNISDESWKNHHFQSLSSVMTDPSQQGLLNALQTEKNLLIQGPPGTGKSQTLTAILINALENGKKCLVVCEKRTALEVLQNSLNERGLSDFCLLVKDSTKDRRKAVDSVRERTDGDILKDSNYSHPQNTLNEVVNRSLSLIGKINQGHEKLGQTIQRGKNWTQVVGELLREKIHPQENVRLNIDRNLFNFEDNESSEIKLFIEKAQGLFTKYKIENPTKFWFPRKFVGDNPYNLKTQLEEDIFFLQSKSAQLKDKVEEFKSEYYTLRITQFNNDLAEIRQRKESILKITDSYLSNTNFLNQSKTSSFPYSFLAKFSTKKKTLLSDQKTVSEIFRQLSLYLEKSDFFIPPLFSNNIVDNLTQLETLNIQLESAMKNIESKTEKEVEELNVFREKQVFSTEIHAKIIQLAKTIKEKYLDCKWICEVIELREDNSFIENTDRLIIRLAEGLDKTDSFFSAFDWFRFYNTFDKKQTAIFRGIKSENNWLNSFSKFYLNCLLEKNANNKLPKDEEDIKNLEKIMLQMPAAQISFIKKYWYAKQGKLQSRYDATHNVQVVNLYNKRKSNRHNRLSLRRIAQEDLDLFTAFFPIILTTPDECSKLFRNQRDYFDIVLFDEASQLRLEDTLPALLKGKQTIIAGDEHQMPPSNYFSKIFDGVNSEEDEHEEDTPIRQVDFLLECESLLEFGEELNFEKKYLDFHYRSRHPFLIEFSNQAFYNGRLVPLPITENYTPITFVDVAGEYSDRTNDAEAETVLSILENNINLQADGSYPSVGIATFNLKQRDLIMQKIIERRQHIEYKDFNEKIEALESNEDGVLFIKNLENIQGDERDVIILSTTYGNNKDGRFFNRFGSISQAKGYKLLNVIVTRAKYKIYVCCSVPQIEYLNYKTHLGAGGNNRRGAFFAYLAYARAVSNNDEEQRKAILSALAENSQKQTTLTKAEYTATESPFEEEVFQMLKERFDVKNLKLQYKVSGFRLDIVYDTLVAGVPKIAIECDGAAYHSGREAYLHDIHRQRILENNGFIFYRIWSTNWWQNSSREFEKLAAFIEKEKTRILEMEVSVGKIDHLFTEDVQLSSKKTLPSERNLTLF